MNACPCCRSSLAPASVTAAAASSRRCRTGANQRLPGRRQKNLPRRVGNGLGAVRHSVPLYGNGAAPGAGTGCSRVFVSCSSGLFVLSGQRQ